MKVKNARIYNNVLVKKLLTQQEISLSISEKRKRVGNQKFNEYL